jgi:hypothetical protein
MLDVRCSTFISFFFDQTDRLRPEAALVGNTNLFIPQRCKGVKITVIPGPRTQSPFQVDSGLVRCDHAAFRKQRDPARGIILEVIATLSGNCRV